MQALVSSLNEVAWWGWSLLAVVTFVTVQLWRSTHIGSKLPPSPGAYPIVGSFPLMGVKNGEPAHQMFYRLAKKYGTVVFLRLGNQPTIVVSSSDVAKILLKDQDHIFASRPWVSAGIYMGMNFQSVVFAPSGPYYKRLRKIYTTELLSNRRVYASHALREARIAGTVRKFYEDMERGEATNLSSVLKILSINSLISLIFGIEDESMLKNVGIVSVEELKDIVRSAVEIAGEFNFGDFIPILRWFDPQGLTKRMREVHKRMLAIAEEIIREYKKVSERRGASGVTEPTILDVVLSLEGQDALNDQALAAVIFDMIIAGSDTTAVSSDWTIAELLRRPETMTKLREELDSVVGKDRLLRESDLPSCRFLQSVIKESLRLHPPAPLGLPHYSTEKTVLAGYEIPAYTTALINLYALNRDPRNWEEPLAFKPERFEDRDVNIFGQDFTLMPFSSGRRGCSGMLLGYTMVQLAVGTLCHCFEFQTQGVKECHVDVETERAGVVSMRMHDIHVKVVPRLSSHLYSPQSSRA